MVPELCNHLRILHNNNIEVTLKKFKEFFKCGLVWTHLTLWCSVCNYTLSLIFWMESFFQSGLVSSVCHAIVAPRIQFNRIAQQFIFSLYECSIQTTLSVLLSSNPVLKNMWPEGKLSITEVTKRPLTAATLFKNSMIALVDNLASKVTTVFFKYPFHFIDSLLMYVIENVCVLCLVGDYSKSN